MKTATGLALIAVGAIFAFAVTAQIPDLNLQVAGFIVMLTGLAGLVLRGRAGGWLRRHVVLRRPAAGTSMLDEVSYSPSDLGLEPAVMASQLLEDAARQDAATQDAASQDAASQPDRPAATQPFRLRPVPPGGWGSAARAQRNPAAAVLHDLFTS
jgi:hypothetical protein